MNWNVSPEESGIKLIDFLKARLGTGYSARQVKRMIESNLCQVNGRIERFASTVLGAGDSVIFQIEIKPSSNSKSPLAEKTRILYEDADLFIYDKPPGFASDDPNFHKALKAFANHLELIHRLDKETSGVLMFAKTATMFDAMVSEFKAKKVKKTYLAVIDGIPTKNTGIIDNYLGKIVSYQGQALWGSVTSTKGQHARTEWELKQEGRQASLLYCYPITGRTHQIRVHLSGIGHPILGDFQYGKKFACAYRPDRCLLHALEISFIHPFTGEPLRAAAKVPEDIITALQNLDMSG